MAKGTVCQKTISNSCQKLGEVVVSCVIAKVGITTNDKKTRETIILIIVCNYNTIDIKTVIQI
ncbi:hypothetical protein A3H38_04955 [candidate division WOR-1 bacterium RIFCSPLOWO2_02_FULL_46_20]|uniref:Uncharacterized protein n=1 Tax=candidate division WOR-1 bacterium RIFCSPLOWO2_02_FULL_46_20 TaxID=1802567 RepID=A0A1F4R435_UNCSA|nr:MAG: hypothetical protein A3H38_04955 [candidate division WOR-1 bacterium RIFCSPLOWO2_02_FULL_46_20]